MASQISNNERHRLTQLGVLGKRKDRNRLDADLANMTTKAEPAVSLAPLPTQQPPAQPAGAGGNRLLAGYLAHEFLTKGTLFGKRWDQAAVSRPLASAPRQQEAKEPIQRPLQKQKQPTALVTEPGKPPMAYPEVAHLLKTEDAHVTGVVNPAQLARWLQL